VENGQNVPDLMSIDVTPTEEGFTVVELPKPYTIPAEGVYVGYSVTIDEVLDEDAAYPVVLCQGDKTDGLFLHTSNGFLKWLPMAAEMGFNSMIKVSVSGKEVVGNAAYAEDNNTHYVLVGEPFEQELTFVNHGANGIQSVDVELTLNGATTQQHIDLDEPVEGGYGLTTTQAVTLPAIADRGNYELSVKVTKVNGQDNVEADAESLTPIVALNTVPKHRTLLEEYTGTWCGWCVRGFVGLEKLAELYPDDFVCVSFHNEDPMEILDAYSFPNEVEGFPSAFMDRIEEIDPFYGFNYGVKPMGIVDDLSERNKEFGHASIDLLADYDADNDAVNVTANVTFAYDVENADFALEYILVEDGLTGEGCGWAQNNSYAGNYDESCAELDPYIEGDAVISGLKFSDVAVMVSEIGGIEESIPATIKADERITHTYTFDLANALNTDGENIIQDVNKLKVVALLVNTATGEVVNANKIALSESTGISNVNDDIRNIRSIEYFDLSGRKVTRAQQGVNIMRINYNNGKSRSMKVIRK
jgi:thiol-disulfide isomerase/thioredoxin